MFQSLRMAVGTGMMAVATLLAPAVAVEEAPLQLEFPEAGCGGLSLQACLLALGDGEAAEKLIIAPPPRTATLLDLQRAAENAGVKTRAVKWSESLPPAGDVPAILPVVQPDGRPHFVAMISASPDGCVIIDYPRRPFVASSEMLRTAMSWDGTALYVARDDGDLTAVARVASRREWLVAAGGLVGLAIALIGISSCRKRAGASDPNPAP